MGYAARRLVDMLIIAALVSGVADLQDFALALVGFMIFLGFMAPFVLDEKSAAIVAPRTPVKVIVGYAICAGYTGALLFSGHPIWAAIYVLSTAVTVGTARRLRAA